MIRLVTSFFTLKSVQLTNFNGKGRTTVLELRGFVRVQTIAHLKIIQNSVIQWHFQSSSSSKTILDSYLRIPGFWSLGDLFFSGFNCSLNMIQRGLIALLTIAAILTSVHTHEGSDPLEENDFDIESAKIDYGRLSKHLKFPLFDTNLNLKLKTFEFKRKSINHPNRPFSHLAFC